MAPRTSARSCCNVASRISGCAKRSDSIAKATSAPGFIVLGEVKHNVGADRMQPEYTKRSKGSVNVCG